MSRSRRRAEPIVTQTMVGLFVVAGADVILLVVLLAAVGVTTWTVALGISGFILAVFGGWAFVRWRRLRPDPAPAEAGAADDRGSREAEGAVDPVERLKTRYAAGELADDEFEETLDRLLDSDRQVEAALDARENEESAERPASERSQ